MNEQNNVLQLKKLATKLTGISNVEGNTIADVLAFIEANYTGSGGGGGKTIKNFILYPNEDEVIKSGEIVFTDGTSVPLELLAPDELTLTSANGSGTSLTVITVSPSIEAGHNYKIFTNSSEISRPAKHEVLTDWTSWDGVSEITATKGNYLAVAECDSNNRLFKFGIVKAVSPLY